MKDRIYLVISENRVERMTKNPPGLAANEIYIMFDINVLDAVFKRPIFQGSIQVDKHMDGFALEIKAIEQAITKLKEEG